MNKHVTTSLQDTHPQLYLCMNCKKKLEYGDLKKECPVKDPFNDTGKQTTEKKEKQEHFYYCECYATENGCECINCGGEEQCDISCKECNPSYVAPQEPQPVCKCCGLSIAIRNPSGYCDHLRYPENCKGKCKPQQEAWDRFDETDFRFVMNAEPKRRLKAFIAGELNMQRQQLQHDHEILVNTILETEKQKRQELLGKLDKEAKYLLPVQAVDAKGKRHNKAVLRICNLLLSLISELEAVSKGNNL